MPELPEVETIRSQLSRVLVSQKISAVVVKRNRSLIGDANLLVGKTIKQLRRYSKLLIIDCSDNISLAIHLKMTGRLVLQRFAANGKRKAVVWDIDYPSDIHTHIIFQFDSGDRLYFHDQRTFGYVQLLHTSDVEQIPYVKHLGPEFFRNLSEQQFIEILKKSKRAIKTVLLDQHQVGGIGNIYANEGLWMARIDPTIPANQISADQAALLFTSLSDVMHMAIRYGGTSSDNFRDAYGNKGKVYERLSVYGRAGKPCLRCGTVITKYMFAGRGTFVCTKCQGLR